MSRSIYINVPVKNVANAREFYTKLGFALNEKFSNDDNAVIIIDERIMLMLVTENFFKQNSKREIADTKTVSEVTLAIEVENRKTVDTIIEAALEMNAVEEGEAMEEYGMYSRGFHDLDGHRIDILCMLPN